MPINTHEIPTKRHRQQNRTWTEQQVSMVAVFYTFTPCSHRQYLDSLSLPESNYRGFFCSQPTQTPAEDYDQTDTDSDCTAKCRECVKINCHRPINCSLDRYLSVRGATTHTRRLVWGWACYFQAVCFWWQCCDSSDCVVECEVGYTAIIGVSGTAIKCSIIIIQ